MRYAKLLGLLIFGVAGLLAFAGNASATTLTTETGFHPASLASLTFHVQLESGSKVTCTGSILSGEEIDTGSSTTTVTFEARLAFSGCGNDTVVLFKSGSMEFHAVAGSKASDATVTSTGAQITVLTHNILGTIHCIYTTSNTYIGTLTSSANTGSHALIDMNSAKLPTVTTDLACNEGTVWTGTYTISSPTVLNVDP